jgi:hypothetical protein
MEKGLFERLTDADVALRRLCVISKSTAPPISPAWRCADNDALADALACSIATWANVAYPGGVWVGREGVRGPINCVAIRRGDANKYGWAVLSNAELETYLDWLSIQ